MRVYRKLESMIASLDGYKESSFDRAKNKATFHFDAKKHDAAERKKVAGFIKQIKGVKFHHSMTEEHALYEVTKSMDPKVALSVYNKLKKGDKVKVAFSGAMSSTKEPLELIVSSPHRIVGKSKVGRIILKNPNNMRGMKYTLFNRDGKVSLAQGDMATIMTDLKVMKECVENPEYDPELGKMNIGEMSAKQHYAKFKRGGRGKGFVVSTPIDRDRYPNRERQGLEGPFKSRKSGKIYYYDKKAGQYYDPDSDMYLQVKDIMDARDYKKNMKIFIVSQNREQSVRKEFLHEEK